MKLCNWSCYLYVYSYVCLFVSLFVCLFIFVYSCFHLFNMFIHLFICINVSFLFINNNNNSITVIVIAFKGAIQDFYNLTSLRIVSNRCAQVAQMQLCENQVQHFD